MKLSREEILRMVGLTSRGLGSRLNEIEEGLEGAGDTLERYWTQIVKNEREITLIAGREAENETNIAQLQVTAREISARVTTVKNKVDEVSGVVTEHTTKIGELTVSDSQIRASVSTLTTTVNSNTTKIGELTVSDSQIRASVSTLTTTVNNNTTKIGQLVVSDSQIRASVQTVSDDLDTVSGTVSSHTTKIGQLEVSDSEIRSSVSTLTTTVNGHTSKISKLEQTDSTIRASVSSLSSTVDTNTSDIASLEIQANRIDLRVEEIEGDYATSADLSLYVSKNSVSWLTGSADNVIFNFSNVFQIQHNNQAVMNLDGDGNLKIKGQLEQNSTIGTVLPIKVDNNGNLLRQTVDGTWIANYAGRFVKYKNFVRNGDTFEMRPGDDLLLSNGNYDPKNVYLPLNPSNGKVVSIKNIGGKTVIRPAKYSTQKIRMTDVAIDHFDLNTYDRIELVFYDGTWWGNVSPI